MLVFSTLLVHATSATDSERFRIAASFRFNYAAEASYVDRGMPIPYIYKAGMMLRIPNIPTPEHLAKVFGSLAHRLRQRLSRADKIFRLTSGKMLDQISAVGRAFQRLGQPQQWSTSMKP